jgi:hypothetical protein
MGTKKGSSRKARGKVSSGGKGTPKADQLDKSVESIESVEDAQQEEAVVAREEVNAALTPSIPSKTGWL